MDFQTQPNKFQNLVVLLNVKKLNILLTNGFSDATKWISKFGCIVKRELLMDFQTQPNKFQNLVVLLNVNLKRQINWVTGD